MCRRHALCLQHTRDIQAVSCDEMFIDASGLCTGEAEAVALAETLRAEIAEYVLMSCVRGFRQPFPPHHCRWSLYLLAWVSTSLSLRGVPQPVLMLCVGVCASFLRNAAASRAMC